MRKGIQRGRGSFPWRTVTRTPTGMQANKAVARRQLTTCACWKLPPNRRPASTLAGREKDADTNDSSAVWCATHPFQVLFFYISIYIFKAALCNLASWWRRSFRKRRESWALLALLGRKEREVSTSFIIALFMLQIPELWLSGRPFLLFPFS